MRRLYIIFIKRNTFILDKLKHLILLFVLVNTQLLSAQQAVTLDETVFIHANATTFVSGETLLFKVYCLKSTDKTPSEVSKIAYVELVDESKKSVFKTKIVLEKSTGQGDYFIPTTLKTGNYKLIGYTTWTLNKPVSELFQIDIAVINPFTKEEKKPVGNSSNTKNITLETNNNENHTAEISNSNTNLKLSLPKKVFSNRELVDLKVESTNSLAADGNYSLSVRKIDILPIKNQISAHEFAPVSSNKTLLNIQNPVNKIHLPELRGELISGKVTAKNNTDNVQNLTVALSIPGKSFAFEITQTDANGNFIFNIKNVYYTSNITVQIIDDKANNYDLALQNISDIDYSKINLNPGLDLSYTTKETLLERSISSQIENAYYHKKVSTISKTPTLDPFYFPLAKQYILDDYTRFKTLKETVTEVATELYLKQNDGKTRLHVNDPSIFPQLQESALVLIDGLYLENQNELLTYPMKNVYKIELIVGRYYVGAKAFNGLVSFTTFNKDFVSNQTGSFILNTTILRPQPKKTYNKIEYAANADNERIPDFRNQLFWNPNVTLKNDNNLFYTSDLSGTYEIKLEGFTKSGSAVSLRETIEVKETSAN